MGLTGLWGAYWSLAVEEPFYLVWPTLVRWVRLDWLFYACIAFVASGPLLRMFLAQHVVGASLGLLHFPVARLDGLFAGADLALFRHQRGHPVPLGWSLLLVVLGVGCLAGIGWAEPAELMVPAIWMETLGVSGFAVGAAGLIGLSQNNLPWCRNALSWARSPRWASTATASTSTT